MKLFGFSWESRRFPAEVRRLRAVLRAGLGDPDLGLDIVPFAAAAAGVVSAPARFPEVIAHPLLRGVWASAPSGRGRSYSALAAPAAVLLEAACRPPQLRPRPECSVLVLRHPGDSAPTESERDLLWDLFQVPVYGVLVGFDGRVLGFECEAQCGMHSTADAIFEEHCGRGYVTSLSDLRHPTLRMDAGIDGRLDTSPCGCGRPGPRLVASEREPLVVDAVGYRTAT